MHSASDAFRHQIGRYKFLNQIVKLLAPKLTVRPTPAALRQRLMDLLLVWSVKHPHLPKFRTVYDTLRKQHVEHTPPSDHSVAERVRTNRAPGHERTVFDAIPRELLHSQDPADVQTAKLLIQQALDREQRQLMLRQQHRAEVAQATAVATLLGEMLTAVEQRDGTGQRSADDGLMLAELYEQCRSLQISVAAFAANESRDSAVVAPDQPGEVTEEPQSSSEMGELRVSYIYLLKHLFSFIASVCHSAELLLVNDALQTVIQRYTTVVLDDDPLGAAPPTPAPLTRQPQASMISNTDLLTAIMDDKPLSDNILALTTLPNPEAAEPQFDDIGSLDDIFTSNRAATQSMATDDLLFVGSGAAAAGGADSSVVLLSPTTRTATDEPLKPKRVADVKKTAKLVSELDMFGLESVITGLKNNLAVSQSEKIATVEMEASNDAESLVLDRSLSVEEKDPVDNTLLMPATTSEPTSVSAITPLAQLHVNLATIRPATLVPARIVHDDPAGLKVVLHFALDRPRPDVSVCVLTCTNQSPLPVHGLRIDASASRPCKLRLLEASGSALAGCKPFRPPSDDVTQLLLVANADGAGEWDMTCILSYHLGDDPDQTKELICVKGLKAIVE